MKMTRGFPSGLEPHRIETHFPLVDAARETHTGPGLPVAPPWGDRRAGPITHAVTNGGRTMKTRLPLLAVLLAGLVLAGCESEPPAEPPAPDQPPAEEAAEPAPETPAEETPQEATGLAAAVGHAPADATVVLAVANLAELEKNVKALAGEVADEMNLVSELTADLPLALDATGPLVLILPSDLDNAEPVLVLPVKDASAIKGEDAGAGIVQMKAGEEGAEHPDVFALLLDGWALLAQDSAEPIKAVMRAEKKVELTDAQKTALAERDVWVHLNLPALANMGRQAMKQAQQQAAQQNPEAAKNLEESMKMMDWIFGLAEDITGLHAAADVTPDGIHATVEADLAEGSNLAALAAAGVGVPVEEYKAGLPATDSLVLAAWAAMDWQKAMPPMKALLKPLLDMVAEGETEETQKAIQKVWESYEKWGAVMGNRFAMVLEVPEPGTGVYQLVETFEIKDPDAYRTLLEEYMDASSELMDVIMSKFTVPGGMPGASQLPHVASEGSYEEAAETIEGVPVDLMRIRFKVDVPDGAPPEAAEQIKNMLDLIYGPDGMEFRMAVIGKQGLATMGGPEVMARAIKAAKGEAPDLVTTPKVAAALEKVPEGQCALLLSASNYMYLGMGMADRMMAQNFPPDVLQAAEEAGHGPLARPAAADLTRITGPGATDRVTMTIDVPAGDLRGAIGLVQQFTRRVEFLSRKMQEKAQEQSNKAQPAPAP
jgi:hypothetical protein